MRLVVWNCAMALDRKWHALTALRPDIAILPEAAAPKVLERKGVELSDVSTCWVTKEGGSRNKGLLVAGFGDYSVQRIEEEERLYDIFLPVQVAGPVTFEMIAAWSFNHRSVGTDAPLHAALDRYAPMLERGALLAGDLNNNVLWDRGHPTRDFRGHVERLAALGHRSVYHDATGEAFGEEQAPTIYWRDRTENGPRYHIDFLFEPESWRAARERFEVGGFANWVGNKLSDHCPLICEWDEALLPQSLAEPIASTA
ncbi:endonuclease/exonuclease/phosphatase family protein [Parvularcula oceani]|uniref:endonuclease/exonuclease/phosphatase family protein n=1 Tax=Parvularcula oceani TaxID=1247963 RepID=UPI0012DCD3F4|nr:endonuclease/exonuclease/phosphatase family protein [Parvularcula oceani]